MKILNKLNVAGRTLLTLEGDVLEVNASKVLIEGKEYSFDIAYDMKNTIGIKCDNIASDVLEFV